jgi:cyclic beta-1,2-glucan synthetase
VLETTDLIRSELFSSERLEQHAHSLAAAQTTTDRPPRVEALSKRLNANGEVLLAAHRAIAKAVGEGRSITPAAEWLVDNYHVIEEQIRQIKDDLPTGFYIQLPKLGDGPLAGYPRVFGIAWAYVAHTDSHLDADQLCRFVRAYQTVQPLTIGELWAVPITLRIVLVENLRRIAARIAERRAARQLADDTADALLRLGANNHQPTEEALQTLGTATLNGTYTVQLLQRLRDHDPTCATALSWIEKHLAEQGTTPDTLVRDEHAQQGASNVTVRNVITSMREISTIDWTELFESTSLVDVALREGSDFAALDFQTRDSYRQAIEELARGSRHSELEVARWALSRAASRTHARERDPGYHLIAGGRADFEAALAYRASWRTWSLRLSKAAGIRGYIVLLLAVSIAILAVPIALLWGLKPGLLAGLACVGLFPAMDAAMALVNSSVMGRHRAKRLPALELRDGVPESLRVLVVIPTMLTTMESITEHVERLEIHYLSSLDGDIYFALLTDWTDSTERVAAGDSELLAAATRGIARLNSQYGPAAAGSRFLLLHRERQWNASQQRWIGWERKRGKLHELNRLLRGAEDTSYASDGTSSAGRPEGIPAGVRYVITLDADTQLPRDAVRRLVGKMAHPLNRPLFDSRTGRVIDGYAILQPRVSAALPMGAEGSVFQRIFSSGSGLDPYASAVSDVYQDLCGEGSYVGKGIYDIDAFEASLTGRIPENTLLSHDLFEGIFARAGLVSDIEVIEEYPDRYDVAASRAHRWARGDWQLLPWLFWKRRHEKGKTHSTIPLIGRWKILDNLRRTLTGPATFLALLTGWTLPAGGAAIWTAFVIATVATPGMQPVLAGLWPRPSRVSLRNRTRMVLADARLALTQLVMLLALLANQAYLMCDAMIRTLFRLTVSRRHMLEWTTAAQAQLNPRLQTSGFYWKMSPAIVLATFVCVTVLLGYTRPALAVPMAALWALSPWIAAWTSRSRHTGARLTITAADTFALRLAARRSWRYFETYVTAADNHLPPDNFQEDPAPVVARRTSPTNIGLYLLSVVAARDFGWIGTLEMIERLELTLHSMQKMERHKGHFYNWYGTGDLQPLLPRYISSVDSGNLIAHLMTVANACNALSPYPAAETCIVHGICDSYDLCRESFSAVPPVGVDSTIRASLLRQLQRIEHHVGNRRQHTVTRGVAKLGQLSTELDSCVQALAHAHNGTLATEAAQWAAATRAAAESHLRDVNGISSTQLQAVRQRLDTVATLCRAMAEPMRFDFLYNPHRRLLSIGYLVLEGELDSNYYDLLASEARLASFMGIASGDLPAKHWFRLGRAVTPIRYGAALVSWSGSMFEYLMPSLVMRSPAGSLLEQTSRLIVERQIDYGKERGVPWGISESAYNGRDLEMTYQYSSFGVPGLGLKRGLHDNVVIAPYATALAAMVDPHAAAENFERITGDGGRGAYGFYEALDYTPSRLLARQRVAIVRCYMAHHQGMTILSLANALMDGLVRTRFHADPRIKATELLLQERPPRNVASAMIRTDSVSTGAQAQHTPPAVPTTSPLPHDPHPRSHILSNGQYSVMLTGAGSGYSRWLGLAVTRWQEDVACDALGSYIYLRDVESGETFSATHQPTCVEADSYDSWFQEYKASFVRFDGDLTTTLDIVLSAENDAEVRRVSVGNMGSDVRVIEITSYAELVLAPDVDDLAHPAFSKLFVHTERHTELNALLATRRRRNTTEPEIWAAHLAVTQGDCVGPPEFETDRSNFIGRGRELRAPESMLNKQALSGSTGTVLDPIFSIRQRVRIAPGATAHIAFWTVVAHTRDQVLDLADKHRDNAAYDRALTLSWTQALVQLHHIGVSVAEADLFQRLAGHLLHIDQRLRPSSEILSRVTGGQAALWALGISGTLPVIVVCIDDMDELHVARQLLRAFEYWRLKQLSVDLVILNERAPSYTQELQDALDALVANHSPRDRSPPNPKVGSIRILRADIISRQSRLMLMASARAVIMSRRGSLADQFERLTQSSRPADPRPYGRQPPNGEVASAAVPALEFFNGTGGFTADGSEYVTVLSHGASTPAPWINVIANGDFGFTVSAEGSGYTWSGNSREQQLTPWSNDPVTDRPGECLYLRDENTGAVWTPTPLPIRHPTASYVCRHGKGYSRFEHTQRGLSTTLLQFVPLGSRVKVSRLTIVNTSTSRRSLSCTAYVEWVLGRSRSLSAPHIFTELDLPTGALFARNVWNADESSVAFLHMGAHPSSICGDRSEFLGRNGAVSSPLALALGAPLSGRVGSGLDPCGAIQRRFDLGPGESTTILCLLGTGDTAVQARSALALWTAADIDQALAAVRAQWHSVLSAVNIRTPDRALNVMINGWLLYQTLGCRINARTGFYQSSGAYGFRDQLQDGMALSAVAPELVRQHLLRTAGRQFLQGDVQHWWLPETGRGIRTRITDDRAWLCYCTAHYLAVTADAAILDERVPYLDGPVLRPDEMEDFSLPSTAAVDGSLYEHCVRALEDSASFGVHGLPLMGTGDWNDGMNRVGAAGRGESVWLGWFLHAALTSFIPIANGRGDLPSATRWQARADALKSSLEQAGWDGQWYRRGFFDDGTPLGSSVSPECQIDSIAQSWGVISGAGSDERIRLAMQSFDSRLVKRETGLVLLFTPPFDHCNEDPGYVKAYPPGIRENGGQYTHAAIWSVIAYALLGEGERAVEMLSMLNPINHALTPAQASVYRVEPYVVAADIYSVAPNVGRGGWTWYTGSAAWMYRAGVESILGCRIQGTTLQINPCIPKSWPGFEVSLRYRSARYEIAVSNPSGVNRGLLSVQLDGTTVAAPGGTLALVDDGLVHQVHAVLG